MKMLFLSQNNCHVQCWYQNYVLLRIYGFYLIFPYFGSYIGKNKIFRNFLYFYGRKRNFKAAKVIFYQKMTQKRNFDMQTISY